MFVNFVTYWIMNWIPIYDSSNIELLTFDTYYYKKGCYVMRFSKMHHISSSWMKFLFFGNVTLIVACCFYKKCMHKHTTKNMQFHTFMEPLTLLQPLTCMMFMTFCSKMKTFSTKMSMETTFLWFSYLLTSA